jgi:hypothetical protein
MAAARRRWVCFDISPVFTDFSPKNNEKKQAQCLHKVSSEPSKLRKK